MVPREGGIPEEFKDFFPSVMIHKEPGKCSWSQNPAPLGLPSLPCPLDLLSFSSPLFLWKGKE